MGDHGHADARANHDGEVGPLKRRRGFLACASLPPILPRSPWPPTGPLQPQLLRANNTFNLISSIHRTRKSVKKASLIGRQSASLRSPHARREPGASHKPSNQSRHTKRSRRFAKPVKITARDLTIRRKAPPRKAFRLPAKCAIYAPV